MEIEILGDTCAWVIIHPYPAERRGQSLTTPPKSNSKRFQQLALTMYSTVALAIAFLPSLVAAWLPHFLAKPARVVEFNDRFVMKDGNSPYDDEFIARYAVDEGGNTILVELPLVAATEQVGHYPPTKTTKEGNLNPRSSFTFICPTSVQCNDGGCCAIGDYCAIRDGALGCCPIGSLCDASPIPGCSVYCLCLSFMLTQFMLRNLLRHYPRYYW